MTRAPYDSMRWKRSAAARPAPRADRGRPLRDVARRNRRRDLRGARARCRRRGALLALRDDLVFPTLVRLDVVPQAIGIELIFGLPRDLQFARVFEGTAPHDRVFSGLDDRKLRAR